MVNRQNVRTAAAVALLFAAGQAAAQTAIPVASSVDDGGSASVILTGLPTNPTGDASFALDFVGDLGVSNETVSVTVDGIAIGSFGATTGSHSDDCNANSQTITVPLATLAPLVSDGQIQIDYQATTAVNDFCASGGGYGGGVTAISFEVSGTITYTSAIVAPPAAPPAAAPVTPSTERFLAGRARSLIQHQPDVVRFVDGRTAGSLNADVTQGRGTFDIQGLVSGPFWGALQASRTDTDFSDQTYVLGAFGGHAQVGPNAVVGAMLQFDYSELEQTDGTDIDGTGWLIGPYFAAQIGDNPLYADGRLLYGETDNTISPSGAASSDFDGERVLATLGLEGKVETGDITLFPGIDVLYVRDEQDQFTDATSAVVAARSVEQTDVALALNFEKPLPAPNFVLTGGASGIYSETDDGAAGAIFDDSWRGRVDLGFRYDNGGGLAANANAFVDGIGNGGGDTYGLTLKVDLRF